MRLIIFSIIVILLASCNASTSNGKADDSVRSPQTIDTVQRVSVPDSLDIIYFKKPYTDPERYTRFFRSVRLKEDTLRQSIEQLLVLPGVRADSVRKCMSEGKILIPLGKEAFKVIYFSRIGDKECRYLYVIRDGAFYYYEIPEMISKKLDACEKEAREPLSPAVD